MNRTLDNAKAVVQKVEEEEYNGPAEVIQTVRSDRLDCEVPPDYFNDIKEVRVIVEYTEETKIFKEVNRWIPCSERLPEEGIDVLVWFEYFRYGNYNRLFQTTGISFVYNGEWSGFVNGSSGWRDLRIIAWQPLPESYKEGK